MSQVIRNGQTLSLNIPSGQSIAVSSITGTYSATVTSGSAAGTVLATDSTGGATYGPYTTGAVIRLSAGQDSSIDFDIGTSPVNAFDQNAKYAFDSSGNVTGLVAPGGGVIPVASAAYPAKTNRVIQRFSDLMNVTVATSNATVVSTIDPSSPWGVPALKLVITFSTTAGRVEVSPPALNIPSWNGHIGYSVWVDDPTKVGQFGVFTGNTGYALYQQANHIMMTGGDLIGGPRVMIGGPIRKNNVTDGGFVFGTTSLQATKLRIAASTTLSGTTTVWVKDCFIPQPMRPIIAFTFDDGFDNWATKILPILNTNSVKATFSINTAQLDIGLGITSANVALLAASGNQVACHNVNNYKLQTLYGTGNGEQNGTGTAVDAVGYITEYYTARAVLENLGIDKQNFCFHPWVQGGMDNAGVVAMDAAGVDIARTTSPYESQMYGFPLGNNALAIRAVNLDNSRTLAQAKAMIDDAVNYGGLTVFMGHNVNDSTADSVTWITSDLAALVAYAAQQQADILTARQLRDKLVQYGLLQDKGIAGANQPVRCIGRLLAANFNSTADQAITLNAGQWKIEGVYVTKPSVSMTTAAGGVYTTTAKGGTAIVAAGQVYSALVAATDVVGSTITATPTVANNTIYLSLTTAQGVAATADVFVFGRPI